MPVKEKKSKQETKAMSQNNDSQEKMPTIKEHLRQSWEMTVGSLKNLIFAWLVAIGFGLGAGLLIISTGIAGVGIGGFNRFQNFEAFLNFLNSPSAIMIGILMLAIVLAFSILQSGLSAAIIIALAKYQNNPSFGEVFGKGMKMALPVFVLGLVMGLIVTSGTIFFIVPGIIMMILLSFSMYEKVLQNTSIMDSLKGSYTLVKNNFGLIFVRWLVVVALYIVVFALLPEMLGAISDGLQGLYGLFTTFGGILFNWIIMAYFIILYQRIRKQTDMTNLDSITWMWLVAVIGWLMIITLAITLANRIPRWIEMAEQVGEDYSQVESGENFEQPMDEMSKEDNTDADFNLDVDTQGLSPETKQAVEDTEAAIEDYMQQIDETNESIQQ